MNNNKIKNDLVIDKDGNKYWYKNNILHRDNDLPAIEDVNGEKKWYQHGQLHREEGPAVEWENRDAEWWINGNLHREDGPSVDGMDGTKRWHINGQELTKKEFNHYMEMKKLNQKLHKDLQINHYQVKLPKL